MLEELRVVTTLLLLLSQMLLQESVSPESAVRPVESVQTKGSVVLCFA